MPDQTVADALKEFAKSVRLDRRANPAVAGDGTALELLLAPRFHRLIERVLSVRYPLPPRVLPEYTKAGVGRPDLAFAREGQPARAFIELKQPGTLLNPQRLRGHDAVQFRRFKELPLWGFCNFHRLHLYRRDQLAEEAVVLPEHALDPATTDAQAERMLSRHDPAPFLMVLETLALAGPITPRTPAELAESMAHAARLVREVVKDQCKAGPPAELAAVRDEFRETLFAHAEAGGYDEADENVLFANAFAQTLAFGLLLAREVAARRAAVQQAPVRDVNRDAYRLLPEGSYPLLRATLRALTQDEILEVLGAAFDVIQDTANAADPALLARHDGKDPILYFYEDFLGVFDPDAKKRHGVFFTPVDVVRYMVAATDRALRSALGTQGLTDRDVLVLDPACGTGTFLIEAAGAAREKVRATMGDGAVAAEMKDLAARLHGFELLVGPYTVAHYRLLHELFPQATLPAERLPIYLADTLVPPAGGAGGAAAGVNPHLGFLSTPIVEERRAADVLKRSTRIIAIFGNPPYRRLGEGEEEAITSGWLNGFWEDLKDPVRRAGWGGELNTFPDLYIAFWRWSLWKLFESDGAPHRGVLCLITNRTFLAGHPYAGLRRMLRRRFDTIQIVDLRGDSRGARPAGVEADENVFAIQVGVCILTAVATGSARAPGSEARVTYADVWRCGAFTEPEKRALLTAASEDNGAMTFVEIGGRDLDDFVPRAFEGLDWPKLHDAFAFRSSGVQTKRDGFVYGFGRAVLFDRCRRLAAGADEALRETFNETSVVSVAAALSQPLRHQEVDRAVYRPLDRRYWIRADRFIDRRRPKLQIAWGQSNVALYALPSGTGAGPAVWVHGLLPDYHAFSGRGGYAFPLWDRRQGASAHNLNPGLLAGLAAVYGHAVSPEETFDAIAGLLSATSYTRRFAWDLEESFAAIPFPAGVAEFGEAARIGAEIRALETFAREPGTGYRSARLTGDAARPALAVPSADARAFVPDGQDCGAVSLQQDGALRVTGVSRRAWEFAVSGYRVLPRWLAARNGEALDAPMQRAILDIVWRLEELLHWFDAADSVLIRALASPLTRSDLGLAEPGTARVAELESAHDQ